LLSGCQAARKCDKKLQHSEPAHGRAMNGNILETIAGFCEKGDVSPLLQPPRGGSFDLFRILRGNSLIYRVVAN